MALQVPRRPIDAYDDKWMPDDAFWEVIVPSRVIRPSRVSVQGITGSRKGGGATKEAEASLEHDLCTQLEMDRRVSRYALQPFTLCWKDGAGRERQYTPDALVDYYPAAFDQDPFLKPVLIEVKPLEILRRDWAKLRPKFRLAFHWCHVRGYRFRILTERHLRTPRLVNSKFLIRYRDILTPPPPDAGQYQRMVREAIDTLDVTTPNGLLDHLGGDETFRLQMIPYIWHSVVNGLILTDLDQKLTMASKIWSPRLQWDS